MQIIFMFTSFTQKLSFAVVTSHMDNRNYVNSDYYEKLLRDKIKRETKVAKMQKKILSEQQKCQQPRPSFPKKPKKLTPEKWLKQQTEENNELEKCRSSSHRTHTKRFSSSDKDLLSEIDKSLDGMAKGFVYKKGN